MRFSREMSARDFGFVFASFSFFSATLISIQPKGFILVHRILREAVVCSLSVCLLACCSCATIHSGTLSYAAQGADPLATYSSTGDTSPVLDPSMIRQGDTYYALSTDVEGFRSSGSLQIRSSPNLHNWVSEGAVFPAGIPAWIKLKLPDALGLWAPDISYFNGAYHVYYNASVLNTQRTLIGLATNATLDPLDPAYKWIDRGLVLESNTGDDFNALDPSILVDGDGSVWLTYGSYWTGIKQRQIDPSTGMLLSSNPKRYDLASRPGVAHNPIEGASLIHHGNYYHLFVSVDYCCKATTAEDNYKQAVGRSSSPHGPFVDEDGTPLMDGGGTILLKGNSAWNAPGGGTAYVDPQSGDSLLIFHAQNLAQSGTPHQWVKGLHWTNDWPDFEGRL